jgi:rhodanese-related sulfurtransferase
MSTPAPSAVTRTPAASPDAAHRHFARRLEVETDPDDVATAMRDQAMDFTLVDARSAEAFAAGHLPHALNLPHRQIDGATVAAIPAGLVVVYCWGPGCNAATQAARTLTSFGRQVKEMIGGFEYYVREGHPVEGNAVGPGIHPRDETGLVTLPTPTPTPTSPGAPASCGC